MVLSLMRRHAKSWLIKFLIAIIALVFIFYFGYSFHADRALKMATVNGEAITGVEYEKLYQDMLESVRHQYRDLLNDNLLQAMDLRNRAMEAAISQKLISQEARRLGLEVTETEVQQAILQYPAFQIGGRFDMRRYQALLAGNRMNPEDFEKDMAANILHEKLRQFLFVFMGVTDQEVLDRYTFVSEKVDLEFVRFDPRAYEADVKVDPEAMKAFFEAHRDEYRVPEKMQAAYVEIDPDTLKDRVKIDEKEVKIYYEYNSDAFSAPKEVKARHILFRLEEDAAEEREREVRERAKGVLEEARQGKDFAELARTHSEGPTKDAGGDLGYFAEGTMVPPFQEAAFRLGKGEISELVRTPFGYHIIKVEDIREAGPKPFEDVREEIAAKLTIDACMDLAHEKGLLLMDQMPYDVDLAEFAAGHGLEAKTIDYVSREEPIPGIGGDQRFRDSLFALDVKETSNLIELEGRFYIFQVGSKKDSYLPDMAEAADRVQADFKLHLASEAAKSAASQYLSEARDGRNWEELATQRGMKIEETGFFTRRGALPGIGNIPGLTETAFNLGETEPYPDTVFENETGAFVIRWKGREGIDKEQFKAAESAFRYSMAVEKQRRAFENWVDALRRKAKIEILTPVR